LNSINMDIRNQIPKSILTILNQLYEIERKLKAENDSDPLRRNIAKMNDALAEEGLPVSDVKGISKRICCAYENPLGESFKETRTDLDAHISGVGTENLIVIEVIKPIIRAWVDGERTSSKIVQKGVVVVESQKEEEKHEQND
jgi:hypothetical protein